MQKRTLAAMTAVGLAAAIAIPTAAFGNARRTSPAGSLSYIRSAQTPYVARLLGANEVPTAGPTTGVGAAAFTFDFIDATHTQVCWDLSYSGITTPTLAHIHRGAAGTNGPPVVPDPLVATSLLPLGPTSATGCAQSPLRSASPCRTISSRAAICSSAATSTTSSATVCLRSS